MIEDVMVPFPRKLLDRMDALQEMADKIYAHKGFTKDSALEALGDIKRREDD